MMRDSIFELREINALLFHSNPGGDASILIFLIDNMIDGYEKLLDDYEKQKTVKYLC